MIPSRGATDFIRWVDFLSNPKALKEIKDEVRRLGKLQDELSRRNQTLDQQEKDLIIREETVAKTLAQEEERTRQLNARAKVLDDRHEVRAHELEAADAALTMRTSELDDLREELNERDKRQASIGAALVEAEDEAAKRTEILNNREQKIAAREKRLLDALDRSQAE